MRKFRKKQEIESIVNNQNEIELTIIISYYKAIDNLKLILMALSEQSNKNFEVILSEDDYNEETINFLSSIRGLYFFSITHVSQKVDNGFRKNEMLNKSTLIAKTDKIVFVDGDCIPHRRFVQNYICSIEKGKVCEGRSVLLSRRVSEEIKKKKSLKKLKLFNLLFTRSKFIKEGIYFPLFPLSPKQNGRGLLGRNWGIHKESLFEINGFDMDYVYAGVGEDNDIEWRLKASGNKTKSVKNKAIVYHIFHPKNYSDKMVINNLDLMAKKQKENNVYCLNGLDSIGKKVIEEAKNYAK